MARRLKRANGSVKASLRSQFATLKSRYDQPQGPSSSRYGEVIRSLSRDKEGRIVRRDSDRLTQMRRKLSYNKQETLKSYQTIQARASENA